jgi:biopolymer transport protein ExbD
MEFFARERSTRVFLNVTSLVDVILLLLLFLVLSATFTDQPAISLTLPRSTTAEAAPPAPSVLTLTAGGETFLNERRLAEPELLQALKQLHASTGEDRIVLQADTHSEHGQVVHLMDLLRESGFTKLSLTAERAQ